MSEIVILVSLGWIPFAALGLWVKRYLARRTYRADMARLEVISHHLTRENMDEANRLKWIHGLLAWGVAENYFLVSESLPKITQENQL